MSLELPFTGDEIFRWLGCPGELVCVWNDSAQEHCRIRKGQRMSQFGLEIIAAGAGGKNLNGSRANEQCRSYWVCRRGLGGRKLRTEERGSRFRAAEVCRGNCPMIGEKLFHLRVPNAGSLAGEAIQTHVIEPKALDIHGEKPNDGISLGTNAGDKLEMINRSPARAQLM